MADLNSAGSAVHQINALDYWAMMIYNQIDRYDQFHKVLNRHIMM